MLHRGAIRGIGLIGQKDISGRGEVYTAPCYNWYLPPAGGDGRWAGAKGSGACRRRLPRFHHCLPLPHLRVDLWHHWHPDWHWPIFSRGGQSSSDDGSLAGRRWEHCPDSTSSAGSWWGSGRAVGEGWAPGGTPVVWWARHPKVGAERAPKYAATERENFVTNWLH